MLRPRNRPQGAGGSTQEPRVGSRQGHIRPSSPAEELGREANLDTEWLKPFHDLVKRAVEAGAGFLSISALTEVLRNPAPTP